MQHHLKRPVILICIVLLVICSVFLFSLFSRKTQRSPSVGNQTPSIQKQFPTPTSTSWQLYTNQYFTATYPPDWIEKDYLEGPRHVSFFLPKGKSFPNFVVQVAPLSNLSVEKIQGMYQKISYYTNSCTVNQQQCTFFLTYGKDASKTNPIQEIAAVLSWKNNSVFFRYEYPNQKRDPSEEEMMNRFLQTVTFH